MATRRAWPGGCVRDLFRDLLEPDRKVSHLHAADVQMVVSEPVTNAVLHGSCRIMLRVRLIDDIVSVGVHDANGEIPHLAVDRRRVRNGDHGLTLLAIGQQRRHGSQPDAARRRPRQRADSDLKPAALMVG